jgi:hypothetical protein
LNYQLRTIASLTIASLYEKLCASDAHIIDLEAQIQTLEEQLKMKTAECELQNRTFVEQLKIMITAECEQCKRSGAGWPSAPQSSPIWRRCGGSNYSITPN